MTIQVLASLLPGFAAAPQRDIVISSARGELVGGLVTLAGVEPVDKARRFVPAYSGGGFVGPLPPREVMSQVMVGPPLLAL